MSTIEFKHVRKWDDEFTMSTRFLPGVMKTQLDAIMELLKLYRRVSFDDPCTKTACSMCHRVHAERILAFMQKHEPIHFVLPAFPAKSPNKQKVIGHLPDLGERLALGNLEELCIRIQGIYSPGARLTVCTDGHVSSDLVGLNDDTVLLYLESLKAMVENGGLGCLDTFSLPDLQDGADHCVESCRRYLLEHFALPVEEVRHRVMTDMQTTRTFNGIARIVLEDLLVAERTLNRSAIRRKAKLLAYQMTQRSIAWSTLIAEEFPNAVRLSVHPQSGHGNKFGLRLLPSSDHWLTPWDGVVVEVDGRYQLLKRWQAEEQGAKLIYSGSRPSHYSLASFNSTLLDSERLNRFMALTGEV